MIELEFSGFFQVRLATDPDTTDEPRGVSGYTFALPGEPDLDRVIRLQPGADVVLREGYEQLLGKDGIGVRVTRVAVNGESKPSHGLFGARLAFDESSQFQMRNYVLTDQGAGTQAIDPFRLRFLSKNDDTVLLERDDVLFPPDPERDLWDVPVTWLLRRGGKFEPNQGMFQRVTNVDDPVAYRSRRLELLKRLHRDAAQANDEIRLASLDKRIHELVSYPASDRRTFALTFSETRNFSVNGPNVTGTLAKEVSTAEWPLKMVQGVWDCDLLCGWIEGQLGIATRPDPEQ